MRPLTVVIKIGNIFRAFADPSTALSRIRKKINIPRQVKYMKKLVESKMSEKRKWGEVCMKGIEI